jgi:hypothetical protein
VTAIAVPQNGLFPIETALLVRNGFYPDAFLQLLLAQGANHAGRWRAKEVARFSVPLTTQQLPGTILGARDRWRFACHAGPFARTLAVQMLLGPRLEIEGQGVPYGQLAISDAGGLLGTATVYGGPTSSTAGDTPRWFATGRALLDDGAGAIAELTPSTDYTGVVSDVDARLLAASVWEISLVPDSANGYLPQGFASGGPVLDAHRQDLAVAARALWRRGAAHAVNWSVDEQAAPRTFAAGIAARNLLDPSLAVVSASSPGQALPFSYRGRVVVTGAPHVMQVYAARGSANGTVTLRSSSGAILATTTITGGAAWYSSGVFRAPSTAEGKCDVFAESAGGTLSVYAVSIYQYET